MSFQDFGPARRRCGESTNRRNDLPAVKVRIAPETETQKKKRPVTHGRVLQQKNDAPVPDVSFSSASSDEVAELFSGSSKRNKSAFAKLTYETQQFQKLVADLEHVLSEAGESPEAAWRARILSRSAQDTDRVLCDKLLHYEQSLLSRPGKGQFTGLRTAQSACVKLHRDFKRSHRALVTCLTEYERRQQVEVSRLGAIGYNNNLINNSKEKEEDYFDRAMRQKELERMNASMHKVNQIYKELANLVENQQDDIDRVEQEVETAAANVESASDEIHCYGKRGQILMCGAMDLDTFDTTVSIRDDNFQSPRKDVRVHEDFHWMMPFETMKEDMTSVQQDILGMGQDLLTQGKDIGKRLECGAVESTIDNDDELHAYQDDSFSTS